MRKRELVKMNFDTSSTTSIILLYGGGKEKMPLESVFYYFYNKEIITRVTNGGMCSVVAMFRIYTFFNDYNLPFAILFGDII